MPLSAASTGQVDYVLDVAEMPAKLIEYRDRLANQGSREDPPADAQEHLATILGILRAKTGHDFRNYKTKTVMRRIRHRTQLLKADSVLDYIQRLRDDPREAELLFRDLLIGVTEFFRDPKAFQRLEDAIDVLLMADRVPPVLRVWVPACSTGEEVYSLAIIIRERIEELGKNTEVQIFGTDIDDRAIEFARSAKYRRVDGISPERLQRWFVEDDGSFCPIRQIRAMCVFSVHNVSKDPPFSRIDMISCRNLMIYMDGELQDRLLRTFHYALKPDGLLFLGLSEGISRHTNLFSVLDKAAHLFQRQNAAAGFPAIPMQTQTRTAPSQLVGELSRGPDDKVDRAARLALAKHSPVYFVVDRQSTILRYSGKEVSRYLELSAGMASLNLFSNLRKNLRGSVRSALESVIKTAEGVVVDRVSLVLDSQPLTLQVIVEPLQGTGADPLFVVALHENRADKTEQSQGSENDPHGPATQAAEQELNNVRAQLQSTIADLETANEEMKSSAEEYQSINEELQSTNEELQTSKEEMQSINEELHTVNAEMISKNDLLSNLNSDLQNLLDSTQIATIFLDDQLRIKNFTPGMADIFSLRESDKGRPLTDIVTLLAYEDLRRDAERVLRELAVIERELDLQDRGASYVMRIRPYRSIERVIEGVVMTFVDVTERKKADAARVASERRFAAIVNQATVGVAETDPQGRFLLTNVAFQSMSGRSAEELMRMNRQDLVHPDDLEDINRRFANMVASGQAFEAEYRLLRADATAVWVHDSMSVLHGNDGQLLSTISITLEIEERKRAEDKATLLLGELDHRVKNILAIVSSIVAQTLRAKLSPEDFSSAIQGRILAITRAHNLLTRRGTASVGTLRALLETELDPYRDRNLRIEGPDIELTPKAGLTIAMAIHELASNAAKYGSLSDPKGRLDIVWSVAGGTAPLLHLNWTETGGPPVPGKPEVWGFGTTLIERSLNFDFDAKVDRTFPVTGVVCKIDIPFSPEIGELRPGERVETK
jgi:two-component system CheB/CheR fusion protein